MFKVLDENIDLLIKYSRSYLVLSCIIFLIVGGPGTESIGKRTIVSLFFLLAYFLFYNFVGVLMKMQKKVNKHNWEKVKKTLKFQLNCLIVFFTFGIFMFILGGIINFEMFTLLLISINAPIGIVLGSIKAKQTYLPD